MSDKSAERLRLRTLEFVRRFTGRNVTGAAFAVVAEAMVVAITFSKDQPAQFPLLMHLAAIAVLVLILFWRRSADEDLTISAIMVLVIAVAGPAGALVSMAMLAAVDHAGAGPEVLHKWYARLSQASGADPAAELHDRVSAGRVLKTEAPAPENFVDIIAEGTLTERQAALGLMARHCHPDFAPALQAALRSPEPVVRVQAAAVVSRVRGNLKSRIRAMIATPHDLEIADAAELLRLARCPLVDRPEAEKCRAGATGVFKSALANGRDVKAAAVTADTGTAPEIERFLMEGGRLQDFRIARRIHGLVIGGDYRVRMISKPAGAR